LQHFIEDNKTKGSYFIVQFDISTCNNVPHDKKKKKTI